MSIRPLPLFMSFMMLFQFGCYNTYTVSMDQLKNIQESDGETFKVIETAEGQEVTVTENSRVGVIDKEGVYYPISPFNFTISELQLVAPDEDLLLPRPAIEEANIKLIDPTMTSVLVGGVLVAIIGIAVGVVLTPSDCKGDFCQ
jgi:hypothetical protein